MNFSGAANYVLDPKKASELIASKGVRLKNTNSIVKSFVVQSELNTRVTKPVGHTSLSFSAQDKDKLSNEFMLKVADDYMNKMGIINTQFPPVFSKLNPPILSCVTFLYLNDMLGEVVVLNSKN